MKKFGYDENGNRIFSKFTGLPVQPLSYHIVMVIIVLVILSPILYLVIRFMDMMYNMIYK